MDPQDELRERFKKFPPDIQASIKRAFKQVSNDLKDTESRTARSIRAIGAFAQDPKKGRRLLEIALIEDPVLRKTACEVIRQSRTKKRAMEREKGLQVDDPRRGALRTRGCGGNHS